jgi:hypothetical protein
MPSPPSGARATSLCGVAVSIMTFEASDNLPSFEISAELADKISAGFGFALTKKELWDLEEASRDAIRWRRLVLSRGIRADYEGYARAVERHKRIGRLAENLLRELVKDEAHGDYWCLRSKNERFRGFHPNALMKPIPRYKEIAPMLQLIRDFAREPERRAPERGPGRVRSLDTEGWDLLLQAVSGIFRTRGKSPTVNYKNGRYTSALMRGLTKLHDALPSDVHARSSNYEFVLGSYIATWIKTNNKKRTAWQSGKNRNEKSISS